MVVTIIRILFHGEGKSMLTYEPVNQRRTLRYRVLGLIAFTLWLSFQLCSPALGEGTPTTAVPTPLSPSPTAAATTQTVTRSQAVGENRITKTDIRYKIDFPYLQAIVPNSLAWLYQPGTTINQPIMFNADPKYYLRRQFNNRISQNGAIFMKGDEKPDLQAESITLYGKNCMDFSLFGSLSNYQDAAYYQAHPTLYLITPQGDYQLDIFAGIRTRLNDARTWKVPQNPDAGSLMPDLADILERSFLTPNPESLPIEGDAWVVLATDSTETQGNRYVLYARKRPIDYATDHVVEINKMEMDSRATENGYVTVPNVGTWMLYAQNDSLWSDLVFETQNSARKRTFGDGGCGPTAVAMAIANLVPKEDLPKLNQYASEPFGYRFCTCSVNDYWCNSKHLTYPMTTPDEFLRYFPLAVANFATGNNVFDVQGRTVRFGTNMSYLDALCGVYGLNYTKTNSLRDAFAALKNEHTMAIACTTGYGSPFTKTSHFLVLAGVDEEYLYVLDPLRRAHYDALDRKGFLDVIKPGLVRIKLEDAAKSNISPIYVLHRNASP